MAAIELRGDYDATRLRDLARRSKDARQVRRLLSLAAVYDGARRGDAAAVGGMDRQILRDRAVRFNAEGPDGLIDRKARGAKPKLTAEQLSAVVQLIEEGPIPAIHGVVRWRLVDLVGWIYDEYGVTLDLSRLGKILKGLGYARLSTDPSRVLRWNCGPATRASAGSMAKRSASASHAASYSKAALSRAPCWS